MPIFNQRRRKSGRIASGRWTAIAVLLAAASIVGGGATYAAFVDTTSNSSNSLSAKSTYPRCYADEVVVDAPVSYWKLDEPSGTSAADSAGSNTGTYTNFGATLGGSGALAETTNKAPTFDGINDYVAVPDANSLDVADVFTIEAWIKRGTTGTQTIAYKGSNFALQVTAAGSSPANALTLLKPGVANLVYSSTALADTTTWHHVAATKNGATVKLYIDGVDRTGTVTNQTFTSNTTAMWIGARPDFSEPWNGGIDEVAVDNTALSATRIRAHYNAGRCYRDEPDADSSLVSRWRLGESVGTATAFDSKGTNHGLYRNGPTLAQTGALDGDTNNAVSFDGTDDYVDAGDVNDFTGSASFSAEAWVYRTGGVTLYPRILGKWRESPTTDGWHILFGTNATVTFERASNNTRTYAVTATALATNRWYHVAATYDGTSMRVYINGVLEGTSASAVSLPNTDTPLTIGGYAAGGNPFGGKLDDPAVYNTALSAARIQAHYIAGKSYRDVVLDASPASYWRFGETSGTNAADEKSAVAGTYTGSPTLNQSGAIAGDADPGATFATGKYVTLGDNYDRTGTSAYTLEAWVYRTGGAGDQMLFLKWRSTPTIDGIQLWARVSDNKFWAERSAAGTRTYVTSTTSHAVNTWYHVAVTYDGTNMRLYVNGSLEATTASSVSVPNLTDPFNIASGPTGTNALIGTVDEPALYTTALSAAQIKLHYDAGKDAPR